MLDKNTFIVCSTIVGTLLSVAYPILIQVIARIEDKFSSLTIGKLFDNELSRKLFKRSLITSLILILLYLLRLPTLHSIRFQTLNLIIDNSALILLLISTIILVTSFLFMAEKVFEYFNPLRLFVYQEENHKKSVVVKNYDNDNFLAITDLLLYSIDNNNLKLADEITKFCYREFKHIRTQSEITEYIYPIYYYEIVNKCADKILNSTNKRLLYLASRSIGGIWLLGAEGEKTISEQTYLWLWHNLKSAVEYKQDDAVVDFWQNAHQYYVFRLKPISPQHDKDYKTINTTLIEQRQIERKRFLDFTTALGGLLLYKQRFACIHRLFNYTSSIPPRYELLPETMLEVFDKYFRFKDNDEMQYAFILTIYPFPNLEGLIADYTIKELICKYIVVLFLRQYTVVRYYIYQDPLAYPLPPKSQADKKSWIRDLKYFKELVEQIQKDKVLTETLKLDFISEVYCEEKHIPSPLQFIETFIDQLEKAFERKEIEQEIEVSKVEQFYKASNKILIVTFNCYKDFQNKSLIGENVVIRYINGEALITDKNPFADDGGVTHFNFENVMAFGLSQKIKEISTRIIDSLASKTYMIERENVIKALEKLSINNVDFIIVAFAEDIKGISNYNSITLDYTSPLNKETLFIFKKEELPNISIIDVAEDYRVKYKLDKISEDYNLYASIIDLNKNKELLEEEEQKHVGENLQNKIIEIITFSFQIKFLKNSNCIALKIPTHLDDSEIINSLDEIEPFAENSSIS